MRDRGEPRGLLLGAVEVHRLVIRHCLRSLSSVAGVRGCGIGSGRGRAAKLEPRCCRSPKGLADLVHEPAEVGLLDHVEPARAVLRRVAPIVQGRGRRTRGMADRRASAARPSRRPGRRCRAARGRSSSPRAEAQRCARLKSSTRSSRIPTKTMFLPRVCCRWVSHCSMARRVQAVGAAEVRLLPAGLEIDLLAVGFWLRLRPAEAQTACDRDRVEEEGVEAVEHRRVAVPGADRLVVLLPVQPVADHAPDSARR